MKKEKQVPRFPVYIYNVPVLWTVAAQYQGFNPEENPLAGLSLPSILWEWVQQV